MWQARNPLMEIYISEFHTASVGILVISSCCLSIWLWGKTPGEFDAASGTSLEKAHKSFNARKKSREWAWALPGFSKSSGARAQCAAGSRWPERKAMAQGACNATVGFKHRLPPEAFPRSSARSSQVCRTSKTSLGIPNMEAGIEEKALWVVPVAWFSLLGLPYGIQEMLLQNMVPRVLKRLR